MTDKQTKLGRKFAWTPEIGQRIIGAVSAGTSLAAAAAIGGVSRITLRNWRNRVANDDPDIPEGMAEWCAQLDAAEAMVEQRMTQVLLTSAEQDGEWRAALAWLEHRSPDWKPTQKIETELTMVEQTVAKARELMRGKFGDVGTVDVEVLSESSDGDGDV